MKDGFTVFVHLSDVHFNDKRKGFLDLDAEVRNEMERDCLRIKETLGPADGILVTGDIAYAGLPEEYATAEEWLAKLASLLDCSPENTFVAPGNHDVDRLAVSKSDVSRMIRAELRQCDVGAIDEMLARKFRDPVAYANLYEPLANYNQFASRYGCDIGPERDIWESSFKLNDGSSLRVRGLNSTLVSDDSDNNADRKLVLGSFQCQFMQHEGVEYVSLCHHPPQWLRDEDGIDAILKARVRVQLFGHKHSQVLDRINDTLRLTAGAVHPDREEDGWNPRYNWLALHVDGLGEERKLIVKVYPRVWREENRAFAADYDENGDETREYEFELQPWSLPEGNGEKVAKTPDAEAERELESREVSADMDPRRRLTYRYYGLAFNTRIAIAQSLGLLEDVDRDVAESELFRRFFERAVQRRLLERLWEKVEDQYDEGRLSENPFKNQ